MLEVFVGLLGLLLALKVLCVLLECSILDRMKPVISMLHAGDVDSFLKEIDKDIGKARGKRLKSTLMPNKAAGLAYKGQWDVAISLLNSIDQSALNQNGQILYYNNLLWLLLMAERFDKARKLLSEHPDVLASKTKDDQLNDALKGTLATYEFYLGDVNKSREIFADLLKPEQPTIVRAVRQYFLGMLDLKQGRAQEGTNNLDKAAELGKGTFIPDKVKELEKHPPDNSDDSSN